VHVTNIQYPMLALQLAFGNTGKKGTRYAIAKRVPAGPFFNNSH